METKDKISAHTLFATPERMGRAKLPPLGPVVVRDEPSQCSRYGTDDCCQTRKSDSPNTHIIE